MKLHLFLVLKINRVKKITKGGWSGFGTATVGMDPNTFEVLNGHPNKIPTDKILGVVVQNCQSSVESEPSPLLYCSNLSLIYHRFRVNSRQNKVRTCNMFHCLTSSLLSSTSTHLSQVQLENITLQQLTCFASHSSSLPLVHNSFLEAVMTRILETQDKDIWTNVPHTKLTSKSAFEQVFNFPTKRLPLSETVGVCLRCPGPIPLSLLHEKRDNEG